MLRMRNFSKFCVDNFLRFGRDELKFISGT